MNTPNPLVEAGQHPTQMRDAAAVDSGGPLYGRSRESHALSMALRRASAGGAELVVLSGPAGIGKTTLVRSMRIALGQRAGYFISGKFDQLQRDVPFSAIVAALQDLVRQLLTESQAQTRAWRDAIVTAVGRNGRVITDVIPALERIIGPQPPLAALEPAESQNRFNHVFQSFLQLFGRENRPLVVFLDDMQWADPASLRLLTSLLSAAGTHSLLVIASCRDNEVAATHPFVVATRELERRAVPIQTVQLSPLGWSDILQFVGDEISLEETSAASLAETIRSKTGGNPFFMRQFLQKLQSENLLRLDATSGSYRFDLEAIRALEITENVTDLIAQKLDRLDAATRRVLSIAAAIGNRFNPATLSSVAACSPQQARDLLEEAVRDNLLAVTPADASGEPQYHFHHDRIQQAAYALVPPAARPALNLGIGRALLASAGEDPSAELFEIVNHMNQGIALIDSRGERLRLAKLNLLAATRARNSTAYDLATRACRSALELLGWDAWGETYSLAFEAHIRLAECQGLMADFEGALASIDTALANARSNTDRAKLLTVRTHAFLSMGDMTGAVACGRQAAQLFGLDLPEKPEQIRESLQSEIGAIIGWSQTHEIEALLDLPTMTDPDRLALMSLLMNCIPPAYQVNPELFALICCKMVTLSIEHGNCPMSGKGYGSFAAILSGIVGNFRDGDRFGKLGVDLCERLNDITVRSACYFTWGSFASVWMRPIDESIAAFREGVRWGLASGDHPHAAYCAAVSVTHLLNSSATLKATRAQAEQTLELLGRIGDLTNLSLSRSRLRFVDWLREPGRESSLDTPEYDEASVLRELRATKLSRSILAHFQAVRVMHRYFSGQYADAWSISRELEDLMPFVPGMYTVVDHTFYGCLSGAALWDSAPSEREAILARVEKQLVTLASWAEHCPENFAPLHLAVRVEYLRMRGELTDDSPYANAIAAARASRLPRVEAIVSERAMLRWQPTDPARAAHWREQAILAYEAWGAIRKAQALRNPG